MIPLCKRLDTALATGIPLPQAVAALLNGALGEAPSILGLLSIHANPLLALQLAAAILENASRVAEVVEALGSLGIHPLSLLLAEPGSEKPWVQQVALMVSDSQVRAWRTQADTITIRQFFSTCSYGSQTRLVLDPKVQILHLMDSKLDSLLRHDMRLEADLTVMASEGAIELPRRIGGQLKIVFTAAKLRFPETMHIKHRMELRDVAGLRTLPRTLAVKELILERCPLLLTLPSRLPGLRVLDIMRVPVRSIPRNLPELEYLHIAMAPRLRKLHLAPARKLQLELAGLPGLETITFGRGTVLGRLDIRNCPRLGRIRGEGLRVLGAVTLENLPELSELPLPLTARSAAKGQ